MIIKNKCIKIYSLQLISISVKAYLRLNKSKTIGLLLLFPYHY